MDLDIFLLIGQSNMAGRGLLTGVEPLCHPDIFMFRDGRWQVAEEPLHTDKPDLTGACLGMSFAMEFLRANPGRHIGLIPAAVGGTPLSRWEAGADLYADAVSLVRQALKQGSLRGILWHQGEGDSGSINTAERYGVRLSAMFTALRAELGAESVPVIGGELGRFLAEHEGLDHFETVNRHLNGLETVLPNYACVSSEGLHDKGDQLHFDTSSLRELGCRYAAVYLRLARSGQIPNV